MQAELEQMAANTAAELMAVVRSRAFDDATADVSPGTTVDSDEFADLDSEGSNCNAFFRGDPDEDAEVCTAIEDFHGITADFPFVLPEDEEFVFEIDVEVEYVDADMQPTAQKTNYKKVTMTMEDEEERLHSPVEYSEVFSYP